MSICTNLSLSAQIQVVKPVKVMYRHKSLVRLEVREKLHVYNGATSVAASIEASMDF